VAEKVKAMKKLILLLAVVAISHTTGSAQGCLPEGIYFTTQAQIDDFPINYPACTQIEGGVDIWGSDITNLDGLNALTSIGGTLNIHHAHLVNLAGLGNLTFLGGGLSIGVQYNHPSNFPDLTSLTGLEGLTSIGGGLVINACGSLSSLSGLENVTSIQGDLNVRNCPLTSLAGLENVTWIQGELFIYGNSLNSLAALSNLTDIDGGITIMDNPFLTSLSGLDNIDAGSINYLKICYNDTLTTCHVESVCSFLASPGGTIIIAGNSTGCNNPPEVADGCGIAFSCLPFGDYWLFSQADIDNFQALYPGCTQLEGNVFINGDGITNLNGLNIVTSIVGSLSIRSTPLTNLNGLHNLTSIGGDLNLNYQSLTSLNGLGLVTSIGGNLSITGCTALINLIGLDNVTTIGGSLSIDGCSSLTNLTGLNNVTTIGGSLILGNPIMDWTNGSLTSLTGLEGLTSLGGGISIWNNTSLPNLKGLDNLTTIGGDLLMFWNGSMSSLTGLGNVTSLAGNVYLHHDYSLQNLAGMDNVTSIGGDLYINECLMTSLGGMEKLNNIGGSVEIIWNPKLKSLDGIDSLTTIGGLLDIFVNDSLNSISALGNVNSIGGNLTIQQNNLLTSLNGLENIAASSIAGLNVSYNSSLSNCGAQSICDYLSAPNGVVEIYGNAVGCNSPPEVADNCGIILPCLPYGNYYFYKQSEIDSFTFNYPGCTTIEGNVSIVGNDISNLSGLGMVTSIGGNLTIGSSYDWGGGNSSLTSLAGLNSLATIGGYLSVKRNNNLTNLTGLENVTSIGGYLDISYNDALTSLAGLDNLDAGSLTGLWINNNTSLSTCEVESVCNYLVTPGGTILINSNAPGCNSPEDILAACQIGLENTPEKAICAIYPNPSSGQFTVEFYLQQPSMVNLVVHNNLGQVVAKLADGVLDSGSHQVFWNSGNLPAGIYYCRLQIGDQMTSTKISKIQ
jgi:hypothetical protein